MKRIICVLCLLCCGVAFAGQVTINWGADNQIYTTTTCEVGGDVILPAPPTKRGYTFRGWKKDSFNRGTWANWEELPNNNMSYPEDVYGNRTPMENDYMVVVDASQYTPGMTESIIISKEPSSHILVINGVNVGKPNQTVTYTFDTVTYTVESTAGGGSIKVFANKNVQYNGQLKIVGTPAILTAYASTIESSKIYYSKLDNLSGPWRFVYHGIWADDNESGWKPEQQIGE